MSLSAQNKNSIANCVKAKYLFGKEVHMKEFVKVKNLTNLKIPIKNKKALLL